MSTSNMSPAGRSEVTLTPGLDGLSDYQQYLEKTSRKSSFIHSKPPGESSRVNSPVLTDNTEAHQQSSNEGPDSLVRASDNQHEPRVSPTFEEIKPAGRRKKHKRRPHRVEQEEDPNDYLSPVPLALLTLGICLSVFLVSLDRTIVATAIPRITDDFHSYDDVGWYGSAYLVTAGALQPIYGRIFTLFNIKWSFLCALGIFELGSLICGIAPNSVALIIGRAIAGWGSAGILTGSFVVVSHAVPLHRRPVYSAVVGVMFGVGAIVGPLLGGLFTDDVTWRWCFYFNLPVGGATVLTMIFFFKPHKNAKESDKPIVEKVLGLDLLGNFILIVAAVMFFLALQYNELKYPWKSARVIGLLIGAGLTAVIFIFWQKRQGDRALLPPRIVLQRSVAVSCMAAFFIYGTVLLHAYYLPIWFQAIKGANAVQSGVDLIAYMIANALFSVIAGIIVSKIGYFAPPAILGSAIGTIGCGLLSTLEVNSGPGKWVGYQVLASAGLGMAVQQGVIAVQTVLKLDQIPIGIAAIVSMQSLGGAIFVSVGNNILQNVLSEASAANELPGVDVSAVIAAGATQFRSIVPAASLPGLLVVYNNALQKVFIAAVPLAGLSCLVACGLEWKSVKDKKPSIEAAAGSALGPATEYSVAGESIDVSRSRRRSEQSYRSTDDGQSQEKSSFETARTSLQFESVERAECGGDTEPMVMEPDPAHVRDPPDYRCSQISIPGSWMD